MPDCTIVDAHAHYDPHILDAAGILSKLDAAGISKVALIPAMNGPLPHTPDTLLSVLRVLMNNGLGRRVAERIHRSLLTPEGDLKLSGQVITIYSRPDNRGVADLVKAHPDRFLGWIFLNPRNNPRVLDELEAWRSVDGMIGVKLHPHWHDYRTDILDPLLRRVEEVELPILIHLGFGKRGDFHAIANRFPKLRIIAAHAGFPFYKKLWTEGRSHPNLYVDLSSPYINEKLARGAVQVMGPERCIYGTDAPYGFPDERDSYDYGEIKGWIERMPIGASQREAIFGGNFTALMSTD